MGFILGIVLLALDIWAIVNIFGSNANTGPKVAWTLGVLVFPLVGMLAWLLAGPRSNSRPRLR